MLVVCPARLKPGAKTFEPKVATAVGDVVYGAVNANGKIKIYIGVEREPGVAKRYPLAVVEAPALADDILGDGGRVGGALTISVYEDPKTKVASQSFCVPEEKLD